MADELLEQKPCEGCGEPKAGSTPDGRWLCFHCFCSQPAEGVTAEYEAVIAKCDAAIRGAILERSTVQEVSGSIATILRTGVTAEEYERNLRSMFRSMAGR
jgi:hypothetical protein